MKRKNQKKCYRARVVILMIVFTNIYHFNIYTPSEDFCTTRIQGLKTLEDTMRRPAAFLFTKRGRNMFSVIRNLFIQGNMCESKKINSIINSIINFPC